MINISNKIFDSYFEAIDYFLEEPMIGRTVTVVYKTKNNTNSVDFNSSLDEYAEVTETVKLRMYHSPKDWFKSGITQYVDGRVQILGYMSDVDKLNRSSELRLDNLTYKLASQPVRHGFGNRYFLAFLDII